MKQKKINFLESSLNYSLLKSDSDSLIVGVDEVGRGCLFGGVVAAAVAMPLKKIHLLRDIGVNDSKKLTPRKRESLINPIKAVVDCYSIVEVDNITIDQINIFQASLLAMTRAILNLSISPYLCLVDGKFTLPNLSFPQISLIKGDMRSPLIASASILAKVWRDEKMLEYDQRYPNYDLKNNKGYGTKKHRDAIALYGLTPLHRKSFNCGQ
ncbi:ribonuclease HII [Cyanobacterium aponinum UTEX 3222]|uniref:Ribonuclease HII n=2 Tax=Cyanobacterium aponinum TaxID=379064 RepID=A0A844GU20_9CHRO|nr:ribonuclease HII [Cyanobacterium aponinum]MTF39987.1 ribonuclease HII [Cyanobacterium aponinum 0216]WPF87703.1 ribonuclease HII [Cyanobacterium aponinum AL20115]WRL40112.1 ribonuclease HII [Cyanobacterium aponinum UTEX 3221]WRL43008.1 ribonuclease HII [Cyanobacterium aponinum UTEX 3222]